MRDMSLTMLTARGAPVIGRDMSEQTDQIATFTGAEMAGAISMTLTTYDMLIKERLVPPPVSVGRRGNPARWPFSVLCQMVMTGTLLPVVENAPMALRIAKAVSQGLSDQGKPFIPFGMDDLSRALADKRRDDRARDAAGELCPYRTIEAAWRSGLLDETQSGKSDYVLVMIDGELVGETTWRGIKLLMQNPRNDDTVWPVLQFTYGGRNRPNIVRPLITEAEEGMFAERLRNAQSVLQLNLSLALRRAVVWIIKSREGAA